ncbi:hypothetical protein Csa_023529, partial [Cucumis sativus]
SEPPPLSLPCSNSNRSASKNTQLKGVKVSKLEVPTHESKRLFL